MEFNYFYEQKKFEAYWSHEKEIMKEAGMTEEAINQMYQYDWEWFKSKRRFALHNNLYAYEVSNELFDFNALKTDEKEGALLDNMENIPLHNVLKNLKKDDFDILVQRFIKEVPIKDIAKIQGQSPNYMSVKIKRIIKNVKRNYEK